MRKIISKKKNPNKLNKNQLIVGLALVFLMLISIAGFGFNNSGQENSEKIIYNGFEFQKNDDYWVLQIEGNVFVFKNNPEQTEEIVNSEKNLEKINNYLNKPLYIYSKDALAKQEIINSVSRFVLRTSNACPEGKVCEEDWPVKNCSNNFIIISYGDEKISQQEGCVFIQGSEENLLKVVDEFIFNVLGIKE